MNRLLPCLLLAASVLLAGCKLSGGSSSDSGDSGSLDKTFNNPYGFSVFAEDSGGAVTFMRMTLQDDESIVLAGSAMPISDLSRLAVARYFSDGRLDESFGQGGMVIYSAGSDNTNSGQDVALQDDGRIVVCGHTSNEGTGGALVVRLNADGTLDASFGTNGAVVVPILENGVAGGMALAIQPDGAILVAGVSLSPTVFGRGFVLRLNDDGSLDTGFGTGGIFTMDEDFHFSMLGGLTLDGAGTIVASGARAETQTSVTRPLLVGLTSQGRLDPSFGDDGLAVWNDPDDVGGQLVDLVRDTDGSLIAAGLLGTYSDGSDMLVLKFDRNGSLDTNFGDDGAFILDRSAQDELHGLALRSDGRILAVGTADDGEVVKLTLLELAPDGELDYDFAHEGLFTFQPDANDLTAGTDVAVQPGLGILACGVTQADTVSPEEGLVLRVRQ